MITTNATLVHKYDSPSGYVSYLIFQVGEIFTFQEGQFIMIEAEIQGKKTKKPYSIATTNQYLQEHKKIGIVIKKTSDHGMSDRMTQHIQQGDEISIKGPVGHYTNTYKHPHYLFISVGSGLSPNVGLFQHLVYESQAYESIVNIFGERYHNHIVPEIEDIFTAHGQPNIHNLFYLSQEEHIPTGYSTGHVQDGLEQAISLLGTQTTCFLCGKPEMVDDVRTKLEHLGIEKEDIIFEKY